MDLTDPCSRTGQYEAVINRSLPALLVKLDTREEKEYVKGLVVERSKWEEIVWVGATDLHNGGRWRWGSGEFVSMARRRLVLSRRMGSISEPEACARYAP